jgi:uncharacterized protein (DUF302 family)
MWSCLQVAGTGSIVLVLLLLSWCQNAKSNEQKGDKKVGKSDASIITVASAHAHAETVKRFKSQLSAKGIRLFAEIDHAAEAKQAGLTLRPTLVLIFGNPKAGTPLMQSKQAIGLDLPLRVLIWEDEHGKASISYATVASLTQRHEIADRDDTAKALDTALSGLVRDAAAP